MVVFLDSKEKYNDEESSSTWVNVTHRLALKEMSLELSRNRVFIRSVKTTSDSIVDFLGKKKKKKTSLKEESSRSTASGRHFSSDHEETNQCRM